MNDQQWRDSLRSHLADYELPEPAGLWEAVECAMVAIRQPNPNSSPSTPPSPSAFTLPVKMLRWIGIPGAAAAMVAVTLWVGREAFNVDSTETLVTTTDTITETTTTETTTQPTIPADELVAAEHVHPNEPTSQSDPVLQTTTKDTEHPATVHDNIGGKSFENHPAEGDEPEKQDVPDRRRPVIGDFDNGNVFARNEPVKSRKSRRGTGWSARILASSAPGSGAWKLQGGYGTLYAADPPADFSNNAKLGENALTDIMIMNRGTRTYTDTRHSLPVRAGIMLNYGLTDRLGIESGLTYTYLASGLKSGSGRYYYETRQSLHYLGIPVNFNYSLWRNSLLNVYISGGGMVEWNVSGNASTKYMADGIPISRENRHVRVEEPQWSVNASIGLQLNLSRRIGIFADPGVSYRFANGSQVETIYKKTPLNFDLTFGLRISFEK